MSSTSDFCVSCDAFLSEFCATCADAQGSDREEAGFQAGFIWACAIIGMAEAIRSNHWTRECTFHCVPYLGGPCEECGFDDGWRRQADDDQH